MKPLAPSATEALRSRLRARLATSLAAEAPMRTAWRRRLPGEPLAPGVRSQTLYGAADGGVLRPGEPRRVRLIALDAGACLEPAGLDLRAQHGCAPQCEWLVLAGSVLLDGLCLSPRDHHFCPAGHAPPVLASPGGALLFLRESDAAGAQDHAPRTVRDADAGWPDFAPGICRRVLWQRDGQAAMLYRAQPGAQVPAHRHGHDEECLMVEGSLFLDDVLLQAGDYQLAPAGTGHHSTVTDTGAVVYAHGDLDLRIGA